MDFIPPVGIKRKIAPIGKPKTPEREFKPDKTILGAEVRNCGTLESITELTVSP